MRAAGTAEDTAKARKANTAKARGHAESLAPIITRLDPDGSLSPKPFLSLLHRDVDDSPATVNV